MKMTELQKHQQNSGSRFGKTIPSYLYNPPTKPPSRRDIRRERGKEVKARKVKL